MKHVNKENKSTFDDLDYIFISDSGKKEKSLSSNELSCILQFLLIKHIFIEFEETHQRQIEK